MGSAINPVQTNQRKPLQEAGNLLGLYSAFTNEGRQSQAADRADQEFKQKQAQEAEKDNPDSAMMRAVREAYKTQGIEIPEGVTARQMESSGYEKAVGNRLAIGKEKVMDAFKRKAEHQFKQDNFPSQSQFESLPLESQTKVKTLSDSSAKQLSIKNSIDESLNQLRSPEVPEDQKVAIGRALLKTLNSDLGADAVGAEEAKRLGSFLEYKIANFTQPGSFIGRDLDKFVDQVSLKSNQLGASIEKGQQDIESLRSGRSPILPKHAFTPAKEGGGLLPKQSASAGEDKQKSKPDFNSMSNEDIKKFLGK